jgi:hypothetical protein
LSHPCPAEHCDRPAPGTQTICGACESDLRRALADVPDVLGDLDVTLSRQTSRMGHGGHGEPPLAFDERASEVGYVLRSALAGWVRQLQETEPEEWPDDTAQSMAEWLSARLQRLVRHPAAEEAHGEIVTAVRAAERVTDRPAERQFAGRCPACGEPLYAKPGASAVQCRAEGCEAKPVDVHHQLDQMRDRIRDQLAHPTGASALLARLEIKAPESTIRRWAKDHRILAHGTDQRGRSLYRIGDILDVITDMGRSLPA